MSRRRTLHTAGGLGAWLWIVAVIVVLLVFVVLPLVSLVAALIRAAIVIAIALFVGYVIYLIVSRDATT